MDEELFTKSFEDVPKVQVGLSFLGKKRVDIQQTKSCTRKLFYDKILYMSIALYDKTLYSKTRL